MTQPSTRPESWLRRIPLTVAAPGVVGLAAVLLYIVLSPATRTPGDLRSPLIILLFAGLAGGIVGRGVFGYLALIGGGLVGYLVGMVVSLPALGWDLRDTVLGTIFFALTILLFYTPGWALAATFRQAVRSTRGTSRPRFLPSATIRTRDSERPGDRQD